MKSDPFVLRPRPYRAVCEKCGEVYGFKSEKDDLEGLVIPCRKMACGGKVAVEHDLKTSQSESDSKYGSKRRRFN